MFSQGETMKHVMENLSGSWGMLAKLRPFGSKEDVYIPLNF